MAVIKNSVGGFLVTEGLLDVLIDIPITGITTTATSVVYTSTFSLAKITLSGTGLTFNANKEMTGGTITGITMNGFVGMENWNGSGFSISAATLQAAFNQYEATGSTAAFWTALENTQWDFFGGHSGDTFYGGKLADKLYGRLGNDVFVGNAGADLIDGGMAMPASVWEADTAYDYDTVNYSLEKGTLGIQVDMTKTTGQIKDTWGAFDTVKNVEIIIGTAKVDTFRGSDNTGIYESFSGGAGNDIINGGLGTADEVRYDLEKGTLGIVVNLATGTGKDTFGNTDTLSGIEYVRGSNRADTITGSAANERFRGLGGKDTIDGGAGVDWILFDRDESNWDPVLGQFGDGKVRVNLTTGIARDGFGYNETIKNFENARGGSNNDHLVGSAVANVLDGMDGNDHIAGLAGDDTLYGRGGNDFLAGDAGKDIIDGGDASDVILGGLNNDTLTGGKGYDFFVFNTALASNIDRITDFTAADDTIELDNAIFTALGPEGSAISAAMFVTGAAATTAAQRIIYNAATGALLYDADGNGAGAAVQFATLNASLTLTAADFIVI